MGKKARPKKQRDRLTVFFEDKFGGLIFSSSVEPNSGQGFDFDNHLMSKRSSCAQEATEGSEKKRLWV